METKEKHWESGPNQHHLDERVKEQIERANRESERRKENLNDKGKGFYKEKDVNENKQSEGLGDKPKTKNQSLSSQTEDE